MVPVAAATAGSAVASVVDVTAIVVAWFLMF